jgi:hypothetical protein
MEYIAHVGRSNMLKDVLLEHLKERDHFEEE